VNFPVKFPENREIFSGDRFAPDCAHHHPVFRYRTSLGVFAFFPRNAGFRPLLVVSVSVSGERKGRFCRPVSPSKISVPRSNGDRFGDWVVGPSSSPTSPPSSPCKPHISGRTLNWAFLRGLSAAKFPNFCSLCTLAHLSRDFWHPVSASKIPFPEAGLDR
jgi:hypothetical protein